MSNLMQFRCNKRSTPLLRCLQKVRLIRNVKFEKIEQGQRIKSNILKMGRRLLEMYSRSMQWDAVCGMTSK